VNPFISADVGDMLNIKVAVFSSAPEHVRRDIELDRRPSVPAGWASTLGHSNLTGAWYRVMPDEVPADTYEEVEFVDLLILADVGDMLDVLGRGVPAGRASVRGHRLLTGARHVVTPRVVAADEVEELVDVSVGANLGDMLDVLGRGVPAGRAGVRGHRLLTGDGHPVLPRDFTRIDLIPHVDSGTSDSLVSHDSSRGQTIPKNVSPNFIFPDSRDLPTDPELQTHTVVVDGALRPCGNTTCAVCAPKTSAWADGISDCGVTAKPPC
jgi:hypothetical protein